MKSTLFLSALASATILQACGQAPAQEQKQVSNEEAMILDAEQEAGSDTNGLGSVIVYNASLVLTIPTPINRGIKVLQDGELTFQGRIVPLLVSPSALAASDNLTKTREFYRAVFDRNSYDGLGAPIRAAVDVQRYHLVPILGLKENAAWMQPFKHFVFGAGGDGLAGFADALDVIAHEFTHAVVSSTSNLQYVGQSGALNEHLADVFGEIVQHYYNPGSEPYLIGETVLRGELAEKARALRDMRHPDKGLSVQPGKMSEIPEELRVGCVAAMNNDNCGVHTLSGIPNFVATKVIDALGWDAAAKLYYAVMTQRLTTTSDFAEYREAMVSECAATLDEASCDQVVDAFASAGL